MELGLKIYMMIIFGSIIIFFQIDFTHRNIVFEEQISSLDLTNLSAMNDFVGSKDEDLKKKDLIDLWLKNFFTNHNISYDEIEIVFEVVETDPEIVLVTVKGYSDYLMVQGNETITYQSGVLVEKKK